MLKHLKDVFSTISICLLSTTIIPNILEYIRVSLKLFPLMQIYKQPLDQPNLIYIISLIHKTGFKDLDFFLLNGSAIGKILKTMIFVDKIDNAIQIAKHLCSRLSKRIQEKKRSNYIIYIFTANLTTISKTQFLADFRLSETQIWIYIEYANMGINFPDIRRAIQFQDSDYIMLSELF